MAADESVEDTPIVLSLVSGPAMHARTDQVGFVADAGGIVCAATALMLLARQKCPPR